MIYVQVTHFIVRVSRVTRMFRRNMMLSALSSGMRVYIYRYRDNSESESDGY